MKIIVIGCTGTIGGEVVKALSLNKHEVVGASRKGELKVNLDDPNSIRALFEKVRDADAVVSCAGNAVFKPFADLTDADYELGLRSKLMGQVTLARLAKDHLRDGGSITLTTGVLAMHPMRGKRVDLDGECWPRGLCARRGAGTSSQHPHQRGKSALGERNDGQVRHGSVPGPCGGGRRQGLCRGGRGFAAGQDTGGRSKELIARVVVARVSKTV